MQRKVKLMTKKKISFEDSLEDTDYGLITSDIDIGNDTNVSLNDILLNYASSKNFGIHYTFTEEEFNKFKLTTIKNVMSDGKNMGYLVITENANDVKAAIDERKTFVIRTAIAVGIVILIFSFVLNLSLIHI